MILKQGGKTESQVCVCVCMHAHSRVHVRGEGVLKERQLINVRSYYLDNGFLWMVKPHYFKASPSRQCITQGIWTFATERPGGHYLNQGSTCHSVPPGGKPEKHNCTYKMFNLNPVTRGRQIRNLIILLAWTPQKFRITTTQSATINNCLEALRVHQGFSAGAVE